MQGDIVIQLRRIADALEKNYIDDTDKKLKVHKISDLSYCIDVIKIVIINHAVDLPDALVQELIEVNRILGSMYVQNSGLGEK